MQTLFPSLRIPKQLLTATACALTALGPVQSPRASGAEEKPEAPKPAAAAEPKKEEKKDEKKGGHVVVYGEKKDEKKADKK